MHNPQQVHTRIQKQKTSLHYSIDIKSIDQNYNSKSFYHVFHIESSLGKRHKAQKFFLFLFKTLSL